MTSKFEILTSNSDYTEDKYKFAGKVLKERGKWVFDEEDSSKPIIEVQ